MENILFYIGIAFIVVAALFLVAAIVMFLKFKIPELIKEVNGTLEKARIEEMRSNNSREAKQKGKVNVFEELEKHAKVKKNNTHSLNVGTTASFGSTGVTPKKQVGNDSGTTVLSGGVSGNSDFVIEKNIMFVSTSEVI